MKYEDITGKIIGCAMRVHSEPGNGFPEVFYQRALALEFQDKGIIYKRESDMLVYYKNFPEPLGKRRADFVVEDVVLVEIKATTKMEDSFYVQIIK